MSSKPTSFELQPTDEPKVFELNAGVELDHWTMLRRRFRLSLRSGFEVVFVAERLLTRRTPSSQWEDAGAIPCGETRKRMYEAALKLAALESYREMEPAITAEMGWPR